MGGAMSIFLIAEIGIIHNGDLQIAKQLIDAASSAGFDAVKFQKRTIDVVYSKEMLDSPRESPWGTTQRTFISTGMSTLDEISNVVSIFRNADCPFELMHCNSTYPMRDEDANLLCIPMLREKFDCQVGYSGHESSLIKICVAAVALGATSLERHITLDRTMYGSDQAASIETASLPQFVRSVRTIPVALGDGKKVLSDSELHSRNKLRINFN